MLVVRLQLQAAEVQGLRNCKYFSAEVKRVAWFQMPPFISINRNPSILSGLNVQRDSKLDSERVEFKCFSTEGSTPRSECVSYLLLQHLRPRTATTRCRR